MVDEMDDPRAQVEALVAEARQAFAHYVDEFLQAFAAYGPPNELLLALKDFVVQRFQQHITLKPSADRQLRQLVREAYEALTDRDSGVNLRDWIQAARPYVGPTVRRVPIREHRSDIEPDPRD